MSDLSIDFCGIKAPNPFWLSSSPVSRTAEMVIRAFEMGWGGVIWKSIVLKEKKEELIVSVSPCLTSMNFEERRMAGLVNIELTTDRPLSDNLNDLKEVKKRFPDRAVIASLMGEVKKEVWQELAIKAAGVGVDGLELNIVCPHGKKEMVLGKSDGKLTDIFYEVVSWVRAVTKLPLIVKLTGNLADIAEVGRVVKKAGANAISATNTIRSIAGVDLDTLIPRPTVAGQSAMGGYSGFAIKPIALRCIAELAMDKEIDLPLSGIGGVTTWQDAAEFILLGASSVQVSTAVMREGYRIVEDLIDGLSNWMDKKGFEKIEDMVGRSVPCLTAVDSLNLDYKVVATIDKEVCEKCGLCYIACRDGGHQAISLDTDRIPIVDEDKCVGCSLCSLICPVSDCIVMKEVK